MKQMKQALRMIKRNKKESKTYILTLSLSVALLYVFLHLQAMSSDEAYQSFIPTMASDYILLQMFLIVIILICSFLCFAANEYYIKAKAQELCVYLSCGANIFKVAKFLLVQNFIILCISTLIGCLIGIGITFGLTCYLNNTYFEQLPIFMYSSQGLLYWMIVQLYIFFFMTMINVGYAYRSELRDLLDAQKQTFTFDTRVIHIPTKLYAILYIVSFIALCLVPSTFLYTLCCGVAFFAIQGIIRYRIKEKIEKRKQSHTNLQAKEMIVSSMIYTSLKNIKLYMLIMIGIYFFICCFITNVGSTFMQFVLCIGFGFMLLMMGLCIYFKLVLEVSKQEHSFTHLRLLGFQKKDIQVYIKEEIRYLWIVMMAIPHPFILLVLLRYVLAQQMSVMFAIAIVSAYVIVISLFMHHALQVSKRMFE